MFIFALIGMISATSLASTTMMEQKQKATTFQEPITLVDVVQVQAIDFSSFQYEATITPSYTAYTFKSKASEPSKNFATIDDVGWNSQKQFSQLTIYKERLKANYLTDHKKRMSILGIKHNKEFC